VQTLTNREKEQMRQAYLLAGKSAFLYYQQA